MTRFNLGAPPSAKSDTATAPAFVSLRSVALNELAKTILILAIIALLAIPAVERMWRLGFPITHDGTLHVLRTYLLGGYLQQGMTFPRWLPELYLGFGYPVFDFYAPAFYYLAWLLHVAGVVLPQALTSIATVYVVLAGWGMYMLARDVWRDGAAPAHMPGLIAAMAYVYGPYLLINIHVRGAYPEAGAQALLPWILFGVRRLILTGRPLPYAPVIAISLAALALTHNLSLLIFPPLVVIYAALLLWQEWRGGRWQRSTLVWLGVSIAAAMGISAFFWGPMLLQSHFLAPPIPLFEGLAVHQIGWTTALNTAWPYHYSGDIPHAIGLVQLAVAVLGIVLAKRRNVDWWLWIAVAVIATIWMTPLVTPLWNGIGVINSLQFPWRLLSIVGFALALLSGAVVTRIRPGWRQTAAAVAVIAVVILGNRPYLPNTWKIAPLPDVKIAYDDLAFFERDRLAFGTGWHDEFLPIWAAPISQLDAPIPAIDGPALTDYTLHAASPMHLEISATAPATATLVLQQFYFPGWNATLDGDRALPVYPTAQGLLALDVPPGAHDVDIQWTGTDLHRLTAWLSILTLLLFAGILWRWAHNRSAAILFAVAGIAFIFTMFSTAPPAAPLARPVEPVPAAWNVELLGYRTELVGDDSLYVYPYWRTNAQAPDLLTRWELVDAAGVVQTAADGFAYFDAMPTRNWSPAALVKDAQRLILPPGLPAGDYQLRLQVRAADNQTSDDPSQLVGTVQLPQGTGPMPPRMGFELRFNSDDRPVYLDGYALQLPDGRRFDGAELSGAPTYPTVHPGDTVEFTLYWRTSTPIKTDMHSFLHLVDYDREVLAAQDQLPGGQTNSPTRWNIYRAASDTYRLQIPADAASGIYFPRAGLYKYDSLNRMLISTADGVPIGDAVDFAPIKVVNSPRIAPQHKTDFDYGTVATLVGYDLAPAGDLHPGATVDLTVYYRSNQPAPIDYTQFFHLYDEQLGMAAQFDTQPAGGGNPTSAWAPGEIVAEHVQLTIAEDAAPGVYKLATGLYDAAGGGARLPVEDAAGQQLPDQQVILQEVTISP